MRNVSSREHAAGKPVEPTHIQGPLSRSRRLRPLFESVIIMLMPNATRQQLPFKICISLELSQAIRWAWPLSDSGVPANRKGSELQDSRARFASGTLGSYVVLRVI